MILSISVLKYIKHIIKIYLFPYIYLVFRLSHIIKKKFQHQCTSKASALYFKISKSHRHIYIPDIIYTYKCRVVHCLGKSISLACLRRHTYMPVTIFAKIHTAYSLITGFTVITANPAALVT